MASFLEEDVGIEAPEIVGATKGEVVTAEQPPSEDALADAGTDGPKPDGAQTITSDGDDGDSRPEGFEGDWKDPKDRARWAAVSDERAKRREAIAQVDELKQKIARLEGMIEGRGNGSNGQQPEVSKEDALRLEEDFLADPVGFTNKVATEAATNAYIAARVDASAMSMRREKEDFQEVAEQFDKMCDEQPGLKAHMRGQADPARWAYNYVKTQKAMSEGPPLDESALRAKWEEEERERIRQEEKQKLANAAAGKQPPSPAAASASGGTASAKNQPRGHEDAIADSPLDR